MAIERVSRIDDNVRIRNVLVSVSDKRGLDTFIPGIVQANEDVQFYSTGGTHAALAAILGTDSGRLHAVSEYTGQPEMKGGLVKTLDFRIYLGILGETYNPAHRADLERTGSIWFDLVVVNLYPFEQTIARDAADSEDARGNIDIGGPCMLRAASKNYVRCGALCDPDDYPKLLEELTRSGTLSFDTRFRLATKAFRHTADYDTAIATYLEGLTPEKARAKYTLEDRT